LLLSDKYPFLTNYFTTALNAEKHPLPQTILFYGNDLDVQYTLSKEIARLLNCNNDKSDNCECLNCKWIREDSHPAVITISRVDNKPDDDDSKTVISIKQSAFIKEALVNASEFHRVFIFCDRDDEGNIAGLNQQNFQAETANSLLKIIEEPQPGVTFIFLTRYIDDLLSTIISRSQCFFVPSYTKNNYDYSCISGVFENYWEFERKEIFDISQNLQDLSKTVPTISILESIQNYILTVLKSNPRNQDLISHIEILEQAKKQAKLGIKPANIFDDICLKLIK
jgi:DNA polymerase III delta prime subunit